MVSHRLAACGTCLPAKSVYRWQEEVRSEPECLLLLKTTVALAPALVDAVSAAHPYEVPETLVLEPTVCGSRYLDWLVAETSADQQGEQGGEQH